jgi:hypothetical protein
MRNIDWPALKQSIADNLCQGSETREGRNDSWLLCQDSGLGEGKSEKR